MRGVSVFTLITLITLTAATATLHTAYKSSVAVSGAAVAYLADTYPGSTGPALLVSTYGVKVFGGNPSYVITDTPQAVAGNATSAKQIEDSEHWSNWIEVTLLA